ncbi:hypothetical protein BAE44_0010501 [Dichanthelium oligosanthes]|uniref:Uncharacterized protein n=1 Tax=Dichanthelium oligosanthes TaxID=888268 RepID=A0A1E5VTQ7_9POAL|nr:hypothetical protein BAE44_0010501 [Dichanthelium oligosanthes]
MRSSLLVLALLAAACLAHAGAEPAAPRRSLTFDVVPAGPRSDWDWCWESLLTLGLCKHDLLASFFAGRPVPSACCRAADEAAHHCGPFTRAFVVGSLLPHGPLEQCARTVVPDAPATWPDERAPSPPRAPALETSPIVSGGARTPTAPEARTGARSSPPPPRAFTGASSGTPEPKPDMSARLPPRAPRVPSGAHGSPGPKPQTSARLPAPRAPRVPSGTNGSPGGTPRSSVRIPPSLLLPPKVPSGTQGSPGSKPQTSARLPPPRAPKLTVPPGRATRARPPQLPPLPHPPGVSPATRALPPKASGGTRAPVVPGGARDESPPKPKVIAGGSAGGRTRRAPPDAYGAGGVAATPPQKGVRTARPSAKGLPYGPPVE